MFARISRQWNGLSGAGKTISIIVGGVLFIGAAAFGFWTISPLFINRQINEEFPISSAPPTAQALATAQAAPAISQAAPTALIAQQPTAAAMQEKETVAPVVSAPQAPAATAAPSEPIALSAGSFTRIDDLHQAEGSATIYQLPDGKRVLRLENFNSANGPDLLVSLSGHPMPRSSDQAHGQGYVELAALKANQGNQNYDIPDDLNLSRFKSVVIYCRAFSVVFSTAELMQN
jgi:hypothetical protein